jgi:predicted RNA binding protein YcfA (HicA-like mRNA interferase family)
MSRLPDVSGRELVSALVRAGFVVFRQKGSHVSPEKTTPEGVLANGRSAASRNPARHNP